MHDWSYTEAQWWGRRVCIGCIIIPNLGWGTRTNLTLFEGAVSLHMHTWVATAPLHNTYTLTTQQEIYQQYHTV